MTDTDSLRLRMLRPIRPGTLVVAEPNAPGNREPLALSKRLILSRGDTIGHLDGAPIADVILDCQGVRRHFAGVAQAERFELGADEAVVDNGLIYRVED